MGIRYYAYAFNSDQTEEAMKDPMRFVSSDPLADAWGFEPGASGFLNATWEQAVPQRDMLYLDKAWKHLQDITGPSDGSPVGPSYRMFEATPGWHVHGPWNRALSPDEMVAIAEDLARITDADATRRVRANRYFGRKASTLDVEYALLYLHKAREFADGLVRDGRGMVYTIG